MNDNENKFNSVLATSFNNLEKIEEKYYEKGNTIEKKLDTNASLFDTEVIVMLTDYNTLVSSKILYSFIKRLVYYDLTELQYRGCVHNLLEFQETISKLNTLSPALWENFNVINSGVNAELKRFSAEMFHSVIKHIDTHPQPSLLDASRTTKLSELSTILLSQLDSFRIISVNATIEGVSSEFHIVMKSYLHWLLKISGLIKVL